MATGFALAFAFASAAGLASAAAPDFALIVVLAAGLASTAAGFFLPVEGVFPDCRAAALLPDFEVAFLLVPEFASCDRSVVAASAEAVFRDAARDAAAARVGFGLPADAVSAPGLSELDAGSRLTGAFFGTAAPLPALAFAGRAAVPRLDAFGVAAFRAEDPAAVDFSAAASSVARAGAKTAVSSPAPCRLLALRVDCSAILPVVATVVSEGIVVQERSREK